MADLVAAGLAHHRAVTFDFALRAWPGEAGGLNHVIGRLLAAPALGVDAGVDHEPRSAEQEGLEEAGAAEWIVGVDTELVGELLGIECPAFGISIEGEQGADERQFVGIFALPDVAGNCFMRGEAGKAVLAVEVGGSQVNPELAGNLAVIEPAPP